MALPQKLKAFNLFVDALSYHRIVNEITIPKLTTKTEDYQGGGMDAPVKVDMGMEALSMEFKVGGFQEEIFEQYGLTTVDGLLLRFAGALENEATGEVKNMEIIARGRYTEIDSGNQKTGDDTEVTVKVDLTYYKLTINGRVIVEIDVLEFKKIVNGKDLLSAKRTALGI